jgi:hypothetical protein
MALGRLFGNKGEWLLSFEALESKFVCDGVKEQS